MLYGGVSIEIAVLNYKRNIWASQLILSAGFMVSFKKIPFYVFYFLITKGCHLYILQKLSFLFFVRFGRLLSSNDIQ